MSTNIINDLISAFSKLPSLGPKSAKRIVLHLLNNKETMLRNLLNAGEIAYKNIRNCEICGNLCSDTICDICKNSMRNAELLCVVETVSDLWAIENSAIYGGYYHILNGTLSAMEGRGPDDLNIATLIKRLKSGTIKEVILATNPTIEGQTTAHYIADLIKDFNVKITRPAYGIPLGSEFNYLDDSTLDIAFKNKKDF